MVQGRPQGIQVAGRRSLAAILLRRGIAVGADHGALLAGLEYAGDAEVNQADGGMVVHHDVGGLDVAEDHRLRFVQVQVLQHVAQLHRPVDDLVLRQELVGLAQHGFQVLAFDKLHHQVGVVFLGEVVVDARNGRMGEGGQQVGLPLEVAHHHFVHGGVGGQVDHFLDRHHFGDVGKVQVAGPVNRTHPAAAVQRQDKVAVLQCDTRFQLA